MSFYRGVLLTFFIVSGLSSFCFGQDLFINEVQASNLNTIYDHTGDTPDWIEIYNGSAGSINLENYGLTDVDSLPFKWVFPKVNIAPQSHLLVYASGLDLKGPILYWETIIDQGDEWKYIVPESPLPSSWKNTGFHDADWLSGKSGFGYGDDDDSTVLQSVMSVYIRKSFTIDDKNSIPQAYLHMDFDDAFVAYLNGQEIVRENIGQVGVEPSFNTPADDYNHEAAMYSGGLPNEFLLENISNYLVDGENVLAIQVHNHSTTSSDLTAIPIFTIGNSLPQTHAVAISPYIDLDPIGLHTNFKISSNGEHIVLSDETGDQIDSIYTASITTDISLGRKPDGSLNWRLFSEPTPGTANNTEGFALSLPADVQFSLPGGFYPNPISLELSSSGQSDSIYYTLDGSEPTRNSDLYSELIQIDASVTIRARSIAVGFLSGDIISQSYLINTSHDLPVVFVTTDPYNLWDYYNGIYVKGPNAQSEFPFKEANFWQDWERPATVSMYEPDGSMAFQVNAGIKIFGAYSRGNDQKSLSIHCRKSYGYENINYKIFEDSEVEQFETIILRNSGNDFNNSMLRDGFCNKILEPLKIDHQAFRPAVVYLNGEYWGIHNIREKINEEFLATHHQLDEDKLDILERNAEVVRGNSEHYDAFLNYLNSHNLSFTENYNYIKTQIDVENFIKYQLAQIYIDNWDWPGNNIKFWRERRDGAKWKWILFDLDFAFSIWDNDRYTFNTLEFALEPNGPDWPNPSWSTLLLRKLMENESFKTDFINYFADNLNTSFKPAVVKQHLAKMKSDIASEIPDHLERWNGNLGYWNDRTNVMKTFAENRVNHVRNHIQNEFNLTGVYSIDIDVEGGGQVNLNSLQLDSFPWDGFYFNNVPIKLEAIPKPGYQFKEWNGIEENTVQETIVLDSDVDLSVTAVFEPVQLQSNTIVINEINYNSSDEFDPGDWVELFNIGERAVNISGWILKDNDDLHEFVFPEGSVIPHHGYVVVCRDHYKFAFNFPDVVPVDRQLNFGFGGNGDCVKLFRSDGSLEDEVCYENNHPWPAEANGNGASLALIDATSNNEHPLNWKASKLHGTPGAKNLDIITSILDVVKDKESKSVNIYPNPSSSQVNIAIYSNKKDMLQISMVDFSGSAQIINQKYELSPGENLIELALDKRSSRIKNGVYIISLKTDSFMGHHKIIVKK